MKMTSWVQLSLSANGRCSVVVHFLEVFLIFSFIILKNGQTYFKILQCEHGKILKVCLTICQHCERKG